MKIISNVRMHLEALQRFRRVFDVATMDGAGALGLDRFRVAARERLNALAQAEERIWVEPFVATVGPLPGAARSLRWGMQNPELSSLSVASRLQAEQRYRFYGGTWHQRQGGPAPATAEQQGFQAQTDALVDEWYDNEKRKTPEDLKRGREGSLKHIKRVLGLRGNPAMRNPEMDAAAAKLMMSIQRWVAERQAGAAPGDTGPQSMALAGAAPGHVGQTQLPPETVVLWLAAVGDAWAEVTRRDLPSLVRQALVRAYHRTGGGKPTPPPSGGSGTPVKNTPVKPKGGAPNAATIAIGSPFGFTSTEARAFAKSEWLKRGGDVLKPKIVKGEAHGFRVRHAGDQIAIREIEAIRPGTFTF